jgi:hypothetical protein
MKTESFLSLKRTRNYHLKTKSVPYCSTVHTVPHAFNTTRSARRLGRWSYVLHVRAGRSSKSRRHFSRATSRTVEWMDERARWCGPTRRGGAPQPFLERCCLALDQGLQALIRNPHLLSAPRGMCKPIRRQMALTDRVYAALFPLTPATNPLRGCATHAFLSDVHGLSQCAATSNSESMEVRSV